MATVTDSNVKRDSVIRRRITGLLVVMGCAGFCTEAMPQAKIAYVDSQKILTSYAAAVDAQKKLDEETNEWSRELQKMNTDLKQAQDELKKMSLLLSEAKRKEKRDEIEALDKEIQQFQNRKWGEQGEYFRRQRELLQPIIDQIDAVIDQLAQREGYDFVFDSVQGNILYAQQKFDLTDKVLEELEKESVETPTR